MTTSHYVIRGGMAGRERLRVIARVMSPTTEDLFDRVGVEPTARCLDVGCGGGDVTVALARRAHDGAAVGVDVDETKIDLARAEAADAGVENVEFRLQDVMDPAPGRELFDVVYGRFLLTHLPDPAAALANMRERLVPGGVLVVNPSLDSSTFIESIPHRLARPNSGLVVVCTNKYSGPPNLLLTNRK